MHCSQEKFASCFSKIKERNPDEFKSITEQLMQHLQNNIEVELSWARCIESLPVHNLIQCLTGVWCGKCWHLRHLMSAIMGLVSFFPFSVHCSSALWSLCLCHEVIWQWKTSQIKETQHDSAVISIKFTSVELKCRNEHWMLLLCDLGSVSN